MNGNNLIVYSGGVAIAAVKGNEIQSDVNMIEKSSSTDEEWSHFIAGRKSWSITLNYLILTDAGVKDLLNVGNDYTLKFKGRSAEDTNSVSGAAILKTCKISAQRGNLVTGSFQFVGNGPLSVPST